MSIHNTYVINYLNIDYSHKKHAMGLNFVNTAGQVELLLRVHHVNLVSLVGYCDEDSHLALLYEYAPNGDLKQHLSGINLNLPHYIINIFCHFDVIYLYNITQMF